MTDQLRERRMRAKWAEAARARYQRMSSEVGPERKRLAYGSLFVRLSSVSREHVHHFANLSAH